ncbi:hypothetical protein R1sor_010855 [Riccia sorocarpa]|uniref:Uncharacterized protein n=1 Tax=Riccia sorocarpa TaxID=122646 RepID=A0ABD3I2N7_9MARC
MPPFCAPAPPCLHNSSDREPDEETEHREIPSRTQVIALLVDALNRAEAAAAAGVQEDHLQLAYQAYASLCYDFPIVSTSGLLALHVSLSPSLVEVREPLFPITRNFTAGLSYLVSTEVRKHGAADGRPQGEGGVAPESTDFDVRDLEARTRHLLNLSASIFLLAPTLRVTVAYKDEGSSLRAFLASYDADTEKQILSDAPLDHEAEREHATSVETTASEGENSSDDAELYEDDDGSDWEPLETESSVARIAEVEEETASTSDGTRLGWDSLMEKVAHITSSVPKEVISASAWEELKLTKHLNNALIGLTMLGKEVGVEVIPMAEIYTGLLADYLTSGCGSSSVAADLAPVISGLLKIASESKGPKALRAFTSQQKTWESLLLTTLAKLCTKVGGFPVGRYSASKEGASRLRASSVFVRNLWESTMTAMKFLHQQLDNAIRTGDSSQVELLLSVMCFVVKYAPGNYDFGSMLVGSGLFRTVLSCFVKVEAGPHMEVMRQFLLITMATSSSAADYAAQVPAFRAVLTSRLFLNNSFTRPYAIIWPLLLQTADNSASPQKHNEHEAGQELVATLNGIVKLVQDEPSVHKQSGFLKALGADTRSTPVSGIQDGDGEKRQSDKTGEHVSLDDDDKSKERRSEEAVGASEADLVASKTKEVLSSVLLLLKKLSALTKGSRGAKLD